MSEFAKKAKAKGWSMKALAERWGISARQMSNISNSPKKIHWDALEGLENKHERPQQ